MKKTFILRKLSFRLPPPKRPSISFLVNAPLISPSFVGKIPTYLNVISYPLRLLYINFENISMQFGHFYNGDSFKSDSNLSKDLKKYYLRNNGEFVAYSEKVLLKTSKGRKPLVVSPGVYTNAETDQYFIRKYNAKVIGVDPTPIVTKYIDYCYKIGYFTKEQYILEPSALSSKVGTTEFSFGVSDMGSIGAKGETKVKVKTVDLNYIIDKYKLPAIDLLQIDIEGGEYDVIEHFEDIKVPIPQICIEFHNLNYFPLSSFYKNKQMKNALQKLRKLGYRLVASYEPWYRVTTLFNALLIHQDYLK